VPLIARFYGILIYMHYFDHNPPHLHAHYGRSRVVVRLSDGAILRGELPITGTRMVQQWTLAHRVELEDNWRRMQAGESPEKIVGPDGRE
jgi:hypothetical protein